VDLAPGQTVQRGDLTARAGQQLVKASCTHAEQSIVREANARPSNQLEINQPLRRLKVSTSQIPKCNSLSFQADLPRHRSNRLSIQVRFHTLTNRRIRRPAEVRLEFESIEPRRIMAGGDHHSTHGPQLLHGIRNSRGRRRCIRENGVNSVARQDFGRALGKAIR
jgi:hypothetical protein